jgi:hypothetical protein
VTGERIVTPAGKVHSLGSLADRLSSQSSKAGKLQRAGLAVLLGKQDDNVLPTNGRFVFYELEHEGIVRKSRPGEPRRLRGFPAGSQDLGDALFALRERGIVPWWWIEDETRFLTQWSYAASISDYMDERLDEARTNPWGNEPPPLILVESRSLGGVLRRIAADYVCPVASTNGHAGGFLRTDVGPLIAADERQRVLYLGDHDHQGGQIEDNTRHVLEREVGRRIEWERLALTQEQIDEHGLKSIWKRDERYRSAREQFAWECEALGQKVVMDLVREALDAVLPEPLADVLEREAAERERLRVLLNRLAG